MVIIADRDEQGRKHATRVAASLRGAARSVTVVEPAEGKDAYDHLAAGHAIAEFTPVTAAGEQDTDRFSWAHIINWDEAFAAKPPDIEWLIEPLLERGTLNAWFGKPGAWKSLLALETAAGLASGRAVFGQPAAEPVTVLYVDVENSVNDIIDRLSAFGYTAAELARLIYSSFPDLAALDTIPGGLRLLALAEAHQPELVIIDTTSRVIAGGENDADTFLQLYRNTLVPLKARGITVLRLDHPGKDTDRGQRGSSAKDGDVDTVWHVDRLSDTAVNFERRKSRSGHGEPILYLRRCFDPLRHEPGGTGIPPKVAEVIDILTMLVPPGSGVTNSQAQKLLRDAGERFRNDDIAQALRVIRERRGTP